MLFKIIKGCFVKIYAVTIAALWGTFLALLGLGHFLKNKIETFGAPERLIVDNNERQHNERQHNEEQFARLYGQAKKIESLLKRLVKLIPASERYLLLPIANAFISFYFHHILRLHHLLYFPQGTPIVSFYSHFTAATFGYKKDGTFYAVLNIEDISVKKKRAPRTGTVRTHSSNRYKQKLTKIILDSESKGSSAKDTIEALAENTWSLWLQKQRLRSMLGSSIPTGELDRDTFFQMTRHILLPNLQQRLKEEQEFLIKLESWEQSSKEVSKRNTPRVSNNPLVRQDFFLLEHFVRIREALLAPANDQSSLFGSMQPSDVEKSHEELFNSLLKLSRQYDFLQRYGLKKAKEFLISSSSTTFHSRCFNTIMTELDKAMAKPGFQKSYTALMEATIRKRKERATKFCDLLSTVIEHRLTYTQYDYSSVIAKVLCYSYTPDTGEGKLREIAKALSTCFSNKNIVN